jgi:hypothetical protein
MIFAVGCGGGIGAPKTDFSVQAVFSIVPANGSVSFNQTLQLNGVDGTPPYNFKAQGCVSTIDAATGLFHAGASAETCHIAAQDQAGKTASATVSVSNTPPVHGYTYLAANLFSQCAGCHGSSTFGSYSGLMGSGLIVPGNPNGSTIYNVVSSGTMPPGGTSQANITDLFNWIQSGAPDN